MIPCYSARIKQIFYITILLSGLFSCKKDLQSVGSGFVRNGFSPVFDTTMDITAYTVRMDSVATNRLTSYAIGAINDPVFGITKASLIMQVSLPTTSGFSWGDISGLDSLVLQLRFRHEPMADGTFLNDYYGDKDAEHTLNVYSLTEDLNHDSLYYSRRKPLYNPASPIGSWTGKFNFADYDTLRLGTDPDFFPVLSPHIRIRINSSYTDNFYADGKLATNFATIPLFKSAYKGFVIVDETVVSPDKGAIVFVYLNSTVSGLIAYRDSVRFPFPVNTNTEATYNYYEQGNVPAGLIQDIKIPLKNDSSNHHDIGYVQSLGGAKLRIELPKILELLNNPKLTVNGAEIVFPIVAGSNSDKYTLPLNLVLNGSDSIGKNAFLVDQIFENPSYYGGSLNTNYNEYHFNIARHIQFLVDQYKKGNNFNYGMNLVVSPFYPVSGQRVIIDTRKTSGRFKLKLTYTVIK